MFKPTTGGRRARASLRKHESILAPALYEGHRGGANQGTFDQPRRMFTLPLEDDDEELAASSSIRATGCMEMVSPPCRWASASALPLQAKHGSGVGQRRPRLDCRGSAGIAALQRNRPNELIFSHNQEVSRLSARPLRDSACEQFDRPSRCARACAALAPTLRSCATALRRLCASMCE